MNYIEKIDGIRVINKMLNIRIRDFYTYNKLIKKVLNIKTNIPVFINNSIVLLPIKTYKAYDCIWINYIEIDEVIDNYEKTIIKFKNGIVKAFDIKLSKLKRIINNAKTIISYFNNLDIENVNN